MESTNLSSMGIWDFTEELTKLEIKEIKVPTNLKLPNWPSAVDKLNVKLGKRNYVYPTKAEVTGMLRLVRKSHWITFKIFSNGAFQVHFSGWLSPMWSGSHEDQNLERVRVLILFHQFKDELFARVLQQLRHDLGHHAQVAEMVRQAFEPFIPFVVMDQLSS